MRSWQFSLLSYAQTTLDKPYFCVCFHRSAERVLSCSSWGIAAQHTRTLYRHSYSRTSCGQISSDSDLSVFSSLALLSTVYAPGGYLIHKVHWHTSSEQCLIRASDGRQFVPWDLSITSERNICGWANDPQKYSPQHFYYHQQSWILTHQKPCRQKIGDWRIKIFKKRRRWFGCREHRNWFTIRNRQESSRDTLCSVKH